MTQADIIYRAFKDFFAAFKKDGGLNKLCDAFAKAQKPDKLVVTHNICHIEEDWLAAIERGLVYVGKAIEEDRQFIRSEGEVKPIEKVKRVSRESVQHLSRHSDLISRKQKEEIVPDKLYTVERDSDYAVYENKFLYLLLLRIKDFTGVRYDAITNAYREYKGEYSVKKSINTATRRLDFSISIRDEQDDVVSAPADRECAEALSRIDKILESVAFYLRTPLMLEVSRSPKISGKITKTNILLMNKNFNEALNLYEYLLAYEGDGYTITKTTNKLEPPAEVMEELATPVLLSAFLTYEHGLGLEEYLKGEYDKEEERIKEELEKEHAKEIAALKRRVSETGEGVEEYMLKLEKHNAELQRYVSLYAEAKEQIAELEGEIARLKAEIVELERQVEELEESKRQLIEEMRRAEEEHRQKIEQMQREFEEEIENLKKAHEEEIESLKKAHEEELAALKKQKDEEIEKLKRAHAEEIDNINSAHKERVEALRDEHRREIEKIREDCNKKLAEGSEKLKESAERASSCEAALKETEKALKTSNAERDVLQARLTATRKEFGLLTAADDFTTEEGFNALEHEYEVLGKLVRDEWTDVKKMLKKEFYGGIRAAMHTKKAKKSREYIELGEEIARQRQEQKDSENSEENPQNGSGSGE